MNEKEKLEFALFKFRLLSPILNNDIQNKRKYFRELAAKEHDVPHLGKRKFSPDTFKSWLRQHRRHGFDGLVAKIREDKGHFRKIDPQLADKISKFLSTFPALSGAALHRLLISEGTIRNNSVSEGTLRNYIRDNHLRENEPRQGRKKFEKEHINELWIADCLHGPTIKVAGLDRKHKAFLIAAIDDHSRVITAHGWFLFENSIALEIILKNGIRRFGLPNALYCDNGSIFSSSHLQLACARLGIALIHSKPYDSPSRGKIERFFRTVRDKFLALLDIHEILDTEQLNRQFDAWLEKEYHKHLHTGINQTPLERFMNDLHITPAKRIPEEELDRAFQITLHRIVKNDATVSVNNILYECPANFIGKKIQIRYPIDKPENLHIFQDEKPLVPLKKVNPHENANIPAWTIKFAASGEKKND